jgi:hypothetical protein
VEPLYATNTSHRKQETFLYEYPLHCVLLPTKNAQQNAALRYYTPQAWSPFWPLKPASKHSHAGLLRILSWSWPVLLPSDTYRKTITSITAVLLSFVTYLLTLPRIPLHEMREADSQASGSAAKFRFHRYII